MNTKPTKLAPICLFVYNRPEHTKKTLEYLSNARLASESDLYIFADGPKEKASPEILTRIRDVRQIIREKKWCKNIHIKEFGLNQGLANSVIAGVTGIVNQYGTAIVIEDDLLVSKSFIEFMNQALKRYALEEKVMQVSGYFLPVKALESQPLFLPFTTSWGWAVWKRSWDFFDPDSKAIKILEQSWNARYDLNLHNTVDYYEMLLNQVEGKINSWAIRWYLSVFTKKGLVLYPSKSMVQNIGFDNTGTHCEETNNYDTILEDIKFKNWPSAMKFDSETYGEIIKYYKSLNIYRSKNWKDRLYPYLKFLISN